jgi:hypothetical protein
MDYNFEFKTYTASEGLSADGLKTLDFVLAYAQPKKA